MFTTKNLLILIGKNIAISLAVIIISFLIISQFKNGIEKTTNSIALNNKLENELKRRTELFSTIEKDAAIVGNNNELIEKAFIPSNDISLFMNALDSIVTQEGVKQLYRFESPAPSTATEAINTSLISYTNNVVLNINDFKEYLKKFEDLHYFTKIESISISSQNISGWKEPSSITFKATLVTRTIQ